MSSETAWGTYTLLIECSEETTITIGAKGEYTFSPGTYSYTGSACGAGGFARVERHYRTASGENATTHWHIDYVLTADSMHLVDDIRTPGEDIECEVAQQVASDPVDGLGASDCACPSHLHYAAETETLTDDITTAHAAALNSQSDD